MARGTDAESRLVIRGAEVDVLDLRPITSSFLRPHQQKAGVAMPVRKPFNLFEPETLAEPKTVSPFVTPISEFQLVDLAALPSCQKFTLPRGAATELRERLGVSQRALLPDSIDFGYSYFVMATFLSMAIHEPGYFGPNPKYDPLLRGMYERGIAAGRSILGREYFRLRGGALVNRPTISFRESVMTLNGQADAARQAIQLMIAAAGGTTPNSIAPGSVWPGAPRGGGEVSPGEPRRLLRSNPASAPELPQKPRRSAFFVPVPRRRD